MSAAKGYYTAETVTIEEGKVNTLRLTEDGRLMVDSASGGGSAGATETTLSALNAKVGASAAAADAKANVTGGFLQTFLSAFNGTTWDRVRSGVTTIASSFTGFLNTLPWAVYNSSPTTRTNGQGGPLEADSAGNLRMAEQFAPAAEDNTVGVIKVEQRYAYLNIATNTTTTVKSGAGFFHTLNIGKAVASGTITIYDNTTNSGTKISTITFPATLLTDAPYTMVFDVSFSTGLTIVTSHATDITVSWR